MRIRLFCPLLLASVAITVAHAADSRPNVLFIAVDDLRPQLGCYGESHVKSPAMDRLAATGVTFDRAYCMVPTCGASRASLMTSIRPSPKRFVTHLASAEKEAPGITTLNTHFKNHGYRALSLGKVFHHLQDSAAGWSERAWRPGRSDLQLSPDGGDTAKDARNARTGADRASRGAPYAILDVDDDALPDGELAQRAVDDLRRLKAADQPFFLAVGFYKPHLPFVAPRRYWDLYPADTIHLPDNYHRPENAPAAAIHNSGELRGYDGVPRQGPVTDAMARDLIRGYHACVSFTDAQIGKVLAELERLDLARNTIVVLWGDHGWNLGEHTLWCKHSCFETSMRIPLIVRAPGIEGGTRTRALTESIDLYPTLCELAGLPVPAHVQGTSFVALLRSPSLPGKHQAIGRFMNGDTLRTDTYRFTEYAQSAQASPARMLYDHRTDPGENRNIAAAPAQAPIVHELARRLNAGKGRDGDLPRPANP